MGNDIATRSSGGYLASNEDFYSALASEANGLKGGEGGKAFMKFDGNDGTYSYGADDEPLPEKTRMAANMMSYKRGYVIWKAGQVVHEEMVGLRDGPQPEKRDLPNLGPYTEDDGPVEQYTIDYKLIDEPFVEMVFQANNVSKRRALAAFLKDFGGKFRNHPDEKPGTYLTPIIELTSRSFEGKTKSGRKVTKYAPEFKIVDWMSEKELSALTGGNPADYDDEKPALEAPRSRRPRDEDEQDERPRSTRRAARDEQEDEAPRTRRARDPEPEDERPARSRARDPEPEPEEEAPRTRRARDEDAQDERPAARRPAREPEPEAEDERPARRSARRDEPADDVDDERPARRSARRDEPEPEAEDERPARRPAARDEDERDEREDRPRGRAGRF